MPPYTQGHDRITQTALAAKAGDRDSAREFIELTYQQVRRFLGHLCEPIEVDDLTQETYLRAMTGLRRFAGQSAATTWLLSISRRVAADNVRAATRRPRISSLDRVDTPAARFENSVLLERLLDALPLERREAFVSTQVLGLSYEEAAVVCNCPVGTIRSRVSRARAELVEALDEDTSSSSAV